MNVTAIQNYPFAYTIPDRVMDVIPYACIACVATTILFEGLWLLDAPIAFTVGVIVVGGITSKALSIFLKTMQIKSLRWNFETGINFNILNLVETPLKCCQEILECLPLLSAAGGVASLAMRLSPFVATSSILPTIWIGSAIVGTLSSGYTDNDSSSELKEKPFFDFVKRVEDIAISILNASTVAMMIVFSTQLLTMAPISFPIAFFIIAITSACMVLDGEEALATKFGIEKGSKTYNIMLIGLTWLAVISISAYVINSLPLTFGDFSVALGLLGLVFLAAKVAYYSLKNSSKFELLCRHARWGSNEAVMKLYDRYFKRYQFYDLTSNEKAFLEDIVNWLKNSSDRGFAPAQYVYAKLYLSNQRQLSSEEEANFLDIMQMSADQGYAPALYWLGRHYFRSGEEGKGVEFLLKAYEKGSEKALAYLGKHCLGAASINKVLTYLMNAAEKKSEIALYYLGKYFAQDSKTKKSGFELMLKAEKLGYKKAAKRLCLYYFAKNRQAEAYEILARHEDTDLEQDLFDKAKNLLENQETRSKALYILEGIGFRPTSHVKGQTIRLQAIAWVCCDHFIENRQAEAYEILAKYEDTDFELWLYSVARNLMAKKETEQFGLKVLEGIGFRTTSHSQQKKIRLEAKTIIYYHYSSLETPEGDRIFLDLAQSQVDMGCLLSKVHLGYFHVDRLHYTEGIKLLTEVCELENVDEDEVEIIKKAKEYLSKLNAVVA